MAEQLDAGSAEVAHNLAQADHQEGLVAHGGETHSELALFGVLTPGALVSGAMAVFLLVLVFKKVPALIGKALDGKIAGIRAQLDEASKLRAEAEALKAEYEKKLSGAAAEADALRSRAEEEAAQLVDDAKTRAAALVKRHQKMAEEKIAAAERSAVSDIRAKAVQAATSAAASIIAETHDAKADKLLVDGAIKGLGPVV
ncbi:F0F1 ATP synthase subunit B [Sphingobium phenoxybenzoativorans]|uniref:ATP synthase subunit b n=1 Tax=Sphingobium phenoxybenzoativorans TaxID=1592790 RepID=A0A975K2S3_9SPHN|nr:F0F1 ATP synthase subunit B [Sphingobium phenoxybenzoativorans]QUT03854.1 F0F1 ATP synthase subunit B [Sphingobium phenoxybenzoativorans]